MSWNQKRYENDYTELCSVCDFMLKDLHEVEIVSGGARGADLLGEAYAKEHNYPLKKFPAKWGVHGKAAGPIRNQEMAEYSNALIAFWDEKSKGTKSMIDLARKE